MKIIFVTLKIIYSAQNWFQSIFYNERYKKFRKNKFFSNIFTFLSITRQTFEDNLRILANIEKFSRKNSKIYGFSKYVLKKPIVFFYFLIKIILFTLKIYLFAPKIAFKAFFTRKHAKSFVKINFLVTFLHFSV